MKRYLIIIVLLTTTVSIANAQLELGVRGGLLTTTRDFKPTRKQTSISSANNYGLVVTFFGQKYLGVQAEASLTERGCKYLQGDSAYKLTQQAVEVPIMAQARITYHGVSLLLNAGPYVGYVLKQTEELTYNGTTTTTDVKFIKTYDRRFQYGLALGPGLNVALGRIALQAEVRYYMGYAHLYNPSASGAPLKSQETGLGMFAGIMYRFK